ncbi:hypothetical protein SLEP1_g35852 [Rubroshorea leprosula]|uniref:Uncharacterized protein n=1 Tax=Rubroshorea leprosula TaxID=152421 RepID=A0AAV5KQ34_9ROSI|nr:hypothetical protein SLEP1_g35852 [Rubroshorea leprosula]
MPSHLPSRRRRKKSKDLCCTPMKEQKQQTHVSEWRHGGHDLVEKHGGMCKCCLYKQSQFRHGHHINLVAHPEFFTQNPRTLQRRLQKKRAKERQRHVAEVHASQWQQPPGRQKFIWVEKKKHSAASQEANQNLVNAIVSPKTSAKCVPFKSNDSKADKELNVSSKTISLGEFITELPSSNPNLPFVFTRKQDAASSSKGAVKNKANMSAKENKGKDHKRDAATFVPRRGMLPSTKSMLPRRHSASNMKSLQMHKALDEGTYWLQNLDSSLHLTKINGLPFQPCCPSVSTRMWCGGAGVARILLIQLICLIFLLFKCNPLPLMFSSLIGRSSQREQLQFLSRMDTWFMNFLLWQRCHPIASKLKSFGNGAVVNQFKTFKYILSAIWWIDNIVFL